MPKDKPSCPTLFLGESPHPWRQILDKLSSPMLQSSYPGGPAAIDPPDIPQRAIIIIMENEVVSLSSLTLNLAKVSICRLSLFVPAMLLTLAPATARCQSPPPNDNFANRIVLTGANPLTATGSNAAATKEPGEPNHAGSMGGRSVWWSWSTPSNGTATITTAGSTFDTLLGVYTGSSVSTLTTIASNDQDPNGGYTSAVSFNAGSNIAYQIAVDGYLSQTGQISLAITQTDPPSVAITNLNNPATVISWNQTNVAVSATKSNGTISNVQPFLNGSSVGLLTAPPYRFSLQFPGGTNLVFAQATDDKGVTTTSTQVVVYARPANDNYSNALVLSGVTVATNGDNSGATMEASDPIYPQ